MATALELTPEQLQQYIESARKRVSHPVSPPIASEEYSALYQRILQAAELLKTQFKARRVILFGSLAHQAWFAPDSDVDLVVEGLYGEDYLRAWGAVEEVIGDREVDLIDVESASSSLLVAVERYGVEL